MAIWQYTFLVVPQHSVSSKSFEPQYDEDGLFEDNVFWSSISASTSLFEDFEKILPKGKSWSKDLLIFGNEESNCLEVYRENDQVASVSLRVDYSCDYEVFLREVIEFFHSKKLAVIDENHQFLEVSYPSIKNAIDESPLNKRYRALSSK
ncbi:hypothetical protein [Phaeodactylibacter sp.]|uniref:hypothetical protein n=1 Tax=Phaeodactylibacter sp. TaxID=1940289 RepID=UPI0025EBB051|nr:hypothetical protein [Phaeodactylibacter sp.]MCI5090544.1 hypothetical protein [Phaeodactylibacter sp.]